MAGIPIPPRKQILPRPTTARTRPHTVHQIPQEERQGDARLHPDHRVLSLFSRAAKRRLQRCHIIDRKPKRVVQWRKQRIQLRRIGAVGGNRHRIHNDVLR